MRRIFRFKKGEWVEIEEHKNYVGNRNNKGPMIWRDLEGYLSPCGTGWIEGRYARREDLKRNGCREVAPSELKSIK